MSDSRRTPATAFILAHIPVTHASGTESLLPLSATRFVLAKETASVPAVDSKTYGDRTETSGFNDGDATPGFSAHTRDVPWKSCKGAEGASVCGYGRTSRGVRQSAAVSGTAMMTQAVA